ncbi:hypothetical protein RUMHYD_00545 [Blautia hydrogenotrophica DSM 10507]|uniref:Uncharacterized protein n=1 Tax=Blautia hydrogenotrophica (strain DSM 10507 / JCM 14656 / S5a33) TaxID=476272 RepID=C0CI81_BLAHS|nr:hypothetical protein RUMHYD_00545 [Blautia hydrogenotrophica DSM 10507]
MALDRLYDDWAPLFLINLTYSPFHFSNLKIHIATWKIIEKR